MISLGFRICLLLLPATIWAADVESVSRLPLVKDSVKFAVLGDTGTGETAQRSLAELLARKRSEFPFEFALLLGDNLYGQERPRDYKSKFEEPYRKLLEAGVKFYAALGNHDEPDQVKYKLFNMDGKRYYTFKPKAGVRFFALDSNYLDREQIDWLQKELQASGSDWKICFFHHPLYSSGRQHGPNKQLRAVLEPIFLQQGVSVVFSGHEHLYERLKPQKAIYYFTSGAAAKLSRGGLNKSEDTAKGFDQDYEFMLVEIAGDELYFQTISLQGKIIDSGVIHRPSK